MSSINIDIGITKLIKNVKLEILIDYHIGSFD